MSWYFLMRGVANLIFCMTSMLTTPKHIPPMTKHLESEVRKTWIRVPPLCPPCRIRRWRTNPHSRLTPWASRPSRRGPFPQTLKLFSSKCYSQESGNPCGMSWNWERYMKPSLSSCLFIYAIFNYRCPSLFATKFKIRNFDPRIKGQIQHEFNIFPSLSAVFAHFMVRG